MNKRTEKRIPLLTPWIVVDESNNQPIGYVGDISPHGVLVVMEEAMDAGQILDIHIRIPGQIRIFAAKVKTRWCDSNINPQLHCIGCCFVEADEADVAHLLTLAEAQGQSKDFELHRVAGH